MEKKTQALTHVQKPGKAEERDRQKSYSISEVSALLNIPKATIRYWDSQGLIRPERNLENDYREFPFQVVMELSNISFLRGIDIPVRGVKKMLESDITAQKEVLEEANLRMEEKIRELEQQKERLSMQKQALQEIGRLKEEGLRPGKPMFARAVAFERDRESHWKRMIEDPGSFLVVFDESDTRKFQYGIGYEDRDMGTGDGETIWVRREERYLEGLLVTPSYDESSNNLAQQKEELKKAGLLTGSLIAQYLASGFKGDGEVRDYYKLWIEVKGKTDEQDEK